eukprot:CAMPEP_0184300124 /NCGR_PEP_ID=MMETSP1049-20130417/10606_1 /TAXON_ID=77928 /ORGANISM="Proteomonas sulcata, Strain CCMP704" /LENGTH=354 /DNA_ID=CAMNT_0026610767 /DNA_START=32 /DNA_END=1096 /DNA_ORIENTATION=+
MIREKIISVPRPWWDSTLGETERLAISKIGLLFEYNYCDAWYFEVLELLRKMFITSAIVFVHTGTYLNLEFGLLFTILSAVCVAVVQPRIQGPAQGHYLYSLLVLCIILWYGSVLNQYQNTDRETPSFAASRGVEVLVLLFSISVFVYPSMQALASVVAWRVGTYLSSKPGPVNVSTFSQRSRAGTSAPTTTSFHSRKGDGYSISSATGFAPQNAGSITEQKTLSSNQLTANTKADLTKTPDDLSEADPTSDSAAGIQIPARAAPGVPQDGERVPENVNKDVEVHPGWPQMQIALGGSSEPGNQTTSESDLPATATEEHDATDELSEVTVTVVEAQHFQPPARSNSQDTPSHWT